MIHFREGPLDGVANGMFGEENVTGVWDPEHKLYRLMDEDGIEHGIMDSPDFRVRLQSKWWRQRQRWSLILGFIAILLYLIQGLMPQQEEWRLTLLALAFPLMMFAWALK